MNDTTPGQAYDTALYKERIRRARRGFGLPNLAAMSEFADHNFRSGIMFHTIGEGKGVPCRGEVICSQWHPNMASLWETLQPFVRKVESMIGNGGLLNAQILICVSYAAVLSEEGLSSTQRWNALLASFASPQAWLDLPHVLDLADQYDFGGSISTAWRCWNSEPDGAVASKVADVLSVLAL